jgi:hypothetical protein
VSPNPKAFFKKGRIFMTLWAAPRGISRSEEHSTGPEQAFIEIARFVVVKPKSSHSLCLRISTYGGQATTKAGVNPAEHAPIILDGGTVEPHTAETIVNDALEIKIEGDDVSVDPMSRINFAKIYTVEHNIKVRNVGRMKATSLPKLQAYFLQALGEVTSNQALQTGHNSGSTETHIHALSKCPLGSALTDAALITLLYTERPETPPRPSCFVPFRRDADFVDCEMLLNRIREQCAAPASRVALVGLGGVG